MFTISQDSDTHLLDKRCS